MQNLNQNFKKMSVSKKYLKSKPVCKVTFELQDLEAEKVAVVGNFNGWDINATPLKKFKNGKYKATIDLESDDSYEFRYIADGNYINDPKADSYSWNDYAAAENCVLNL